MSGTMKGIIAGSIAIVVLGGGLLAMKLSNFTQSAEDSSSVTDSSLETILLYDLNPNDVVKMEISNQRDKFELVRTDEATGEESSQYQITGYEDIELNTTLLGTLPNNASSITVQQIIDESPDDLEQYGLKEPTADIKATYEDGTEKHLLVGAGTPTSGNTYFKLADEDTVYAVDSNLVASFIKNKNYFVSRICLSAPEDQNNYPIVESLVVERSDLDYDIKVEYDHTADDESEVSGTMSTHRMTEPINAYLDISKSTAYTHGLFGLTGDSVVTVKPTEDELKAVGIDESASIVTMIIEDGTKYVLRLGQSFASESIDGSATTSYFGYFEGIDVLYSFTSAAVPWATMKPTDITSLLIFGTYIYDIGELKVEAEGKETVDFKCTGDSSDNAKVTLNGSEFDYERFKSFYQYLIKTAGEDLWLEEPTGKLLAKITLNRQDGNDGETVEFYETDGRDVIIKHNGKTSFKCRSAYVDVLLANMDKIEGTEDFSMNW